MAALLGAAVVVLPAVASSEASPTISAVNNAGVYGTHHEWSPVTLTARAARALRAHHRLALSVRIVIRPVHGPPVTVTRAVQLRS